MSDDTWAKICASRQDEPTTASQDAMTYGLFKAFNTLIITDNFSTGQWLIYQAIIKMIKYDPIFGDAKPDMSVDDKKLWSDIYSGIVIGGLLLQTDKDDERLWAHIPPRFHDDIKIAWKQNFNKRGL